MMDVQTRIAIADVTPVAVSATVPDWRRERMQERRDSRRLLRAIRTHQAARNVVSRLIARIRHRIWSIATGTDIPLRADIGGGLLMPHPQGIVIHPDARIGPNCLIFQQVTIGSDGKGVPYVGGHVDIGAGAKILGGVRIGDHAVIGANAVVVHDVPAGAIVAGVPARELDAGARRFRVEQAAA